MKTNTPWTAEQMGSIGVTTAARGLAEKSGIDLAEVLEAHRIKGRHDSWFTSSDHKFLVQTAPFDHTVIMLPD